MNSTIGNAQNTKSYLSSIVEIVYCNKCIEQNQNLSFVDHDVCSLSFILTPLNYIMIQ